MRSIILADKLNREHILKTLSTGKKVILFGTIVFAILIFSICRNSNEKLSVEVQDFDDNLLKTVDVGDVVTDDDVEIIYNDAPKNSVPKASSTTILIEDTGRADPFLPEFEVVISNTAKNMNRPKPSYDLLPPPETITTDTTAKEIMTTKVSGLMYDKSNPSAIININNMDYLVRKGDVVNDYKVIDIDRKSVTVQYGANVYKAGVGELFTGDGVNYNAISNLEKKFGGTQNSVNK